VDQRLSPETQSLLSDSSHISDMTQQGGQAEDHEHEDHNFSYPIVTEAAEDPPSCSLYQNTPALDVSAGSASGGSPAAKEDVRGQEPPSSADAPTGIV
jgi:hypothetical protein